MGEPEPVTSQIVTILAAFIYLHVKHYLCDFVLQNDYQLRAKRRYGDIGGALHVSLHAIGTLPVFVLLRPSLGLAIAIIVAELFFHYHVDWLKERILAERKWSFEDPAYWRIFGIDQMLHNMTYVVIVAVTS